MALSEKYSQLTFQFCSLQMTLSIKLLMNKKDEMGTNMQDLTAIPEVSQLEYVFKSAS